jgi:hypothetical protein
MNKSAQEPQRILREHASSRGVDVIDFTGIFEKIIFDDSVTRLLADNGDSRDDIERLDRRKIKTYFLDEDHYTTAGHRVVASELYSYLSVHYPLEIGHRQETRGPDRDKASAGDF